MSVLFFLLLVISFSTAEVRFTLDSGDTWTFSNENKSIQGSATVPGGIYSDLLNNKVLKGPLTHRFNDIEYRWVAKENWTYHTFFELSEEVLAKKVINLVFYGLDTAAEIYVNDQLVGATDNMFVKYVFAIKEIVVPGNNTIDVKFTSPIIAAGAKDAEQKKSYLVPPDCLPNEYQGECHVQMLRKMQASFSWDWGPAFPSVGIWKSVEVEAFDRGLVRDILVTTELAPYNESLWLINITGIFEFVNASDLLDTVVGVGYSTIPEEGIKFQKTAVLERGSWEGSRYVYTSSFITRDSSIERWWPNGLGNQTLYNAFAHVYDYKYNETSEISDVLSFRTLEVVQEELQAGQEGLSFYFKVNGVPVYAKGANWIPGHVLPELSYDSEMLKNAFYSAKEANFNMIRVWGGGLYESDQFYTLADRLGIMIWQDMAFASSMYPSTEGFLNSVRVETEQQASRLRNHPSLVLWSGNNENEGCLASNYFGTNSNFTLYKSDYVKLYVDTIGSSLLLADQMRYYVVSSPSNGEKTIADGYVSKSPGSTIYGDTHFYNYDRDQWNPDWYPLARFVSEYGYQSWPSFKTMRAVSLPEDRNLSSNFTKLRNHHPHGYDQILHLIKQHLPLPDDDGTDDFYRTFLYYNQISQAMGMKTESEKYRRDRSVLTADNKGFNMGALYWMLNDVWEAPTWSSLEFGGGWKLLHNFAKKFFNPVLISSRKENETTLELYVTSDLLEDIEVDLSVSVYSWESLEPISVEKTTELLTKESSKVQRTVALPELNSTSYFLYFNLSNPNISDVENFYFPADFNQVKLSDVEVMAVIVAVSEYNAVVTLNVFSNKPAPFVYLETDEQGFFSDNGFLLLGKKEITFSNWDGHVDIDNLQSSLRVRTL